MSTIAVTHTASCDNVACSNYQLPIDVMTISGQSPLAHCGGCDQDISHTCTPKE